MKSCFGYVRVSTAKQGEGVSLEAQKEAILAFARKNDIAISEWFEEKETAAKSGRPIFSAMLKALRKGKAHGVVIHKIDRSARNFADWAKIGELADVGIDVHFATESLDFRSRGGRLSADIQAVIAADYIRNLREETIKGITGRLKQGLYPFKAPIGYLDNGGGKPKTPDPVRAPLVRELFELYGSGQYSIRPLTAQMERRGLRNERGKPVTKTGIETILGNPFYCGLIRIKRTGAIYEGVHEPLITARLFERVQDMKAGKCGKKVTRHNHTYRGLFRCADCSGAMIAERQKGHIYYRCQTPHCATRCVREEAIEDAVRVMLSRVRLTDSDIDRITREVEAWCEENDTKDEERSIFLQLADLGERMERLTDALIDRLIDKETFNRRNEKLLLEKTALEEKADEIARNGNDPSNIRKFLELVKNAVLTYVFAEPQEKRQIAEWATSNRTVSGKNVLVEPSNWFIACENAVAVLCGAPDRANSRRRPKLRKEQLEAFVRAANSKEVVEVFPVLDLASSEAIGKSSDYLFSR
ncbi:MAG: recombinase family protein [Rhizobiaceae bacterium]